MTLDEAIAHCEEVSSNKSKCLDEKSIKCANEHVQLAEWLKELKAYRSIRRKEV